MPTKEQRIEAFIKEYGELVKKHNIDFAPLAQLVPDGNGDWKIRCNNVPLDMEEFKKKGGSGAGKWFK